MIAFARPRYEYASYADFYRLVTLSGFILRYLDEIDWSQPDTVIATPANGEWDAIPDRRQARLIHWMLERPRADADVMGQRHPKADEVWASDRLMAAALSARYVFLGGVETFAHINVLRRKEHEVVGLMYWSGRRLAYQHEWLTQFVYADPPDGVGCWGERREEVLNTARLMINIHQDDAPWCEPIKFCLAGMYGLALLSETSAGSGYWVPGYHYLSAPVDELTRQARYMLADDVLLARLGARAWRLVCREHCFADEVRKAVVA